MKVRRLETRLWVPRSPDEVFPFFADARNLEQLTPPWLHFQILTPTPIEMRVGTLIDYRIKIRRIPVRWRTEISAWEPPYRFVDEQLRGPYHTWHHEHTFTAVDGGTEIRDVVHYRPRGGPLAPMIDRWFVEGDVTRIFEYRQEQLARHYGVEGEVPGSPVTIDR